MHHHHHHHHCNPFKKTLHLSIASPWSRTLARFTTTYRTATKQIHLVLLRFAWSATLCTAWHVYCRGAHTNPRRDHYCIVHRYAEARERDAKVLMCGKSVITRDDALRQMDHDEGTEVRSGVRSHWGISQARGDVQGTEKLDESVSAGRYNRCVNILNRN
jgi:hypothetical protein